MRLKIDFFHAGLLDISRKHEPNDILRKMTDEEYLYYVIESYCLEHGTAPVFEKAVMKKYKN